MIASERLTGRVDNTAHRTVGTARHVGIVFTALATIFLAFDTVLKVLRLGPAVAGTTALGYPAETVHWIGIIELVCLVLYLVPRTSILGGLLLTGYLGGAIGPRATAALVRKESAMSFEAYLRNIEARTGKTPEELRAMAVWAAFKNNGWVHAPRRK
jgi:DoxX-like family